MKPLECSISPSDEGDYIVLKVAGEFTAKDFMSSIVEAHTLGKEIGTNCYLVDATQAKNVDTAFGNYNFAYTDMKTTEGVDPLATVAGLVDPEDNSHDFVETVSHNAGMLLKLFTDREEAIAYLRKSRASAPKDALQKKAGS